MQFNTNTTLYHIPVLLEESVDLLDIRPDGYYADLTFGEIIELLEAVDFEGILDRDFIKQYIDLTDYTNEQIINKIKQYENLFQIQLF